jgi:inorganic pyrophosphatase/exopolyphosphatase
MFDFSTHEVESGVKTALETDAKEFGTGWRVGAYQLTVWGNEIFEQRDLIVNSLSELNVKMVADWSFVNIVDLESKQSHIFADKAKGEEILSKALSTEFKNGEMVLPNALLRKQIMPKVNEVLEK